MAAYGAHRTSMKLGVSSEVRTWPVLRGESTRAVAKDLFTSLCTES